MIRFILFKLCFMMCLSVIVARWIYEEIGLLMPGAIPIVNAALDKVSIPTHNEWNKEAFAPLVNFVQTRFSPENGSKQDKYARNSRQLNSDENLSKTPFTLFNQTDKVIPTLESINKGVSRNRAQY